MIEKKLYQVGGCVRDKLLGITISDIDWVAVGYEESDFKHLDKIGKDFPVFLNENNEEIALARTERKIGKGYNDFSTSIENVTLEEDLRRRDLTINSIAFDNTTNKYIDPYDGIQDIKDKILRHTSDAFKEDPLRVLRLARFKAKFPDFIVASETKEFVKYMKKELRFLQPDRVYKEIEKVLELDHSEVFFETLLDLNVLDVIFPSIYNQNHNIFLESMNILKILKNESKLLKLTAIYHKINNPKIDIKLPIKLQNKVLFLIKNNSIITNLQNMSEDNIASFFESYKKNKDLFENQLIFAKVSLHIIDEKILLELFDKISQYSPISWIQTQKHRPTGEQIKKHIHSININYVNILYTNE